MHNIPENLDVYDLVDYCKQQAKRWEESAEALQNVIDPKKAPEAQPPALESLWHRKRDGELFQVMAVSTVGVMEESATTIEAQSVKYKEFWSGPWGLFLNAFLMVVDARNPDTSGYDH